MSCDQCRYPYMHRKLRHRSVPIAEIAPSVRVAAPAPSAPPKPVAKKDSVKEKVLALVAEKTGYPVDMLDLDLDLEADLGVDTVKQAEVFATIREAYNIPRDENRKLRDYPTLAHVIRFVYDKRPDLAVPASAAAKEEIEPATTPIRCTRETSPDCDICANCFQRFREGSHPRFGRGEDRLSGRHAGSGSGPRSGSRRRHREAGGDVCRNPSRIQHSAR